MRPRASPWRNWKRWPVISMTDTWVTGIHEGYRTKVVKYGNHTIEINRPILTPAEQAKREEEVRQVLRTYGRTKSN